MKEDFLARKGRMRLNKYISASGFCSRREADRLIDAGCVTVDGGPAAKGMKVFPYQSVKVRGKDISLCEKMVVLAVNKPRGIVCTEEKRERDSIVRFLNYPVRVTYAGRLDKDSSGLLIMTNNGGIINKMMREGNRHEKEYKVTVDKPVTDRFLKRMSEGIAILGTVTKPCRTEKIGKYKFSIVLTQGLNRQIRRMCAACGYNVTELVRTRVLNIELGQLKEGEARPLSDSELDGLYELIKDSSNEAVALDRNGKRGVL